MRIVIGLLLIVVVSFDATNYVAARQERSLIASPRPNILFLISDDHSALSVGSYGDPSVRTPNLDRLSRDGVRFTRAFVASPQCSPSRSSIYTGQAAHTIGTSRLHAPLRPQHTNIVDLLKAAGYFTGIYRKDHLGESFQKKLDFYGGGKDGDGRESFTSFFRKRPKDKPFFLQVGFRDPHRPYTKGAFAPAHDPSKVRVPEFLADTPETREELALYHDEIARMDKEAGELLDLLDEQGLTPNTLVVFTADNGMPFTGAKGSLYEAGINVPLIVRWPGRVKPGQVRDELISLLDLAPTWLESAAVPVPEVMQGRSFLNLLLDRPFQQRESVYAERNWHDTLDSVRAVRDRRYKLIQNYRAEVPYQPWGAIGAVKSPAWDALVGLHKAGKLSRPLVRRFFDSPRPPIELYDLERDPGEFNNLADDPVHAPVVQRLQQLLSIWMQDTNDFLPPPLGAFPRGTSYQPPFP